MDRSLGFGSNFWNFFATWKAFSSLSLGSFSLPLCSYYGAFLPYLVSSRWRSALLVTWWPFWEGPQVLTAPWGSRGSVVKHYPPLSLKPLGYQRALLPARRPPADDALWPSAGYDKTPGSYPSDALRLPCYRGPAPRCTFRVHRGIVAAVARGDHGGANHPFPWPLGDQRALG